MVDNASRDGSAAAARQAGADVVVKNRDNVGFARAVNQGLKEASAELILLLNPDAVLAPDALARLTDCLAAHPSAVLVGPALVSLDGEAAGGARRFSTPLNRLLWHLPLPRRPWWSTPEYLASPPECEHPVPVDYLWGAALLCRRDFLATIGGLDERFFIYSEDEDLGRQARAHGMQSMLVPGAVVRHIGGASTPDPALAQARIEASNARLLAKWEGERPAKLFAAGIGPVLALRALILALSGRGEQARLAWRTCRLLGRARGPESTARLP